jgi:hypothetical protein
MNKIVTPIVGALMAMSTQVHAEERVFVARGHVTTATPTAPAGAELNLCFSYDDDAPAIYTYSDGKPRGYSYASYTLARQTTLTVNGHRFTAANLHVDVADNYGGNVEDSINLYAYPMVMDGTTFGKGGFGFVLGSAPGKTNVLKGISLPSRIEVKRFDSPGFQYAFAQTDGSPNGDLLGAVVDSVKEVLSEKHCED